MRQFDVLENAIETSRAYAPFLIVLQSHHLDALQTIFVAPLVTDLRQLVSSLNVPVEFRGHKLVAVIPEAAGVSRTTVGRVVGSLAQHEDDIRRAFERLLTGF